MMIRIVLSFLLITAFISCNSDPLAKLPEFSVLLQDSLTIFNTRNIPEGKPIILIQFSADCKECQEETAEILENINSFKHTNIYFVTYEPLERLRIFIEYYKLNQYKNITVGYDYAAFLPNHFKTRSTPYAAVYDKNKNLKVIYDGKTTIEKLIKSVSAN